MSTQPLASYLFQPIGLLESCFKEKFGIPRQPGLVKNAWANLRLPKTEAMKEALFGLEQFSHIWLIFVFDRCYEQAWSPRVRPPRLGGDASIGVFASRSPFRPNPIGLSVVELIGIESEVDHWLLRLGACDIVDQTPILDIKPYLAYVDKVESANSGWLGDVWPNLDVRFSELALSTLEQLPDGQRLKDLIASCLAQDPRPAYKRKREDAQREYGLLLEMWNVKFRVEGQCAEVLKLEHSSTRGPDSLNH